MPKRTVISRRKAIRQLQYKNRELCKTVDKCRIALDDWTNTYAEELCNEERVKEAWDRIRDNGGTIHYIACLVQECRNQLKNTNEDT